MVLVPSLTADEIHPKKVVAYGKKMCAENLAENLGAVAAAGPMIAAVSKNDALLRVSYTCTSSQCLES